MKLLLFFLLLLGLNTNAQSKLSYTSLIADQIGEDMRMGYRVGVRICCFYNQDKLANIAVSSARKTTVFAIKAPLTNEDKTIHVYSAQEVKGGAATVITIILDKKGMTRSFSFGDGTNTVILYISKMKEQIL